MSKFTARKVQGGRKIDQGSSLLIKPQMNEELRPGLTKVDECGRAKKVR